MSAPLLSPAALEAGLREVGATRYHDLHRFHRRLHGGECRFEEVQANGPAVEILKRCDGERTLHAIVDDLATTFSADRALIDRDVRALLADLVAKRMVDV